MSVFQLLVLVPMLMVARTHAEADAQAEASAEPLLAGEPPVMSPMLYGGPPAAGVVAASLAAGGVAGVPASGRPAMSACELNKACCSMADSQCCYGGKQRCYTVYEQKCDPSDRPQCSFGTQAYCEPFRTRKCYAKPESKYQTVTVTTCRPKPITKCFTYEKKVCDMKPQFQMVELKWTNQVLLPQSEVTKTHCVDQKVPKCEIHTVEEPITTQEAKEQRRPYTQRLCQMVPKRSPDQTVKIPVTKVVYNTMCFNVPQPSCSSSPCQNNGFCASGSQACSLSQKTSNTICPEPIPNAPIPQNPNAQSSCQQFPGMPTCLQQGSVCMSGYQSCCSMSTKRVCKQVPQRVTEHVQQVNPGRINWQQECQDVTRESVNVVMEPVTKMMVRNSSKCEMVSERQCYNITLPQFDIKEEDKTEYANMTVNTCIPRTISAQHCQTIADGDLVCTNSTEQKGVRYHRTICDQWENTQKCIRIPVQKCRTDTMANCRIVPRQVCQDTCSNSGFCQQCDRFRNGPGFASCPNANCGAYYEPDPYYTSGNSSAFGQGDASGYWPPTGAGQMGADWQSGSLAPWEAAGAGYSYGGDVAMWQSAQAGSQGYWTGGPQMTGGQWQASAGGSSGSSQIGGQGFWQGGGGTIGGQGVWQGGEVTEQVGGQGYWPGGGGQIGGQGQWSGGGSGMSGGQIGGQGQWSGGSVSGGGQWQGQSQIGGEGFWPSEVDGGQGLEEGSYRPMYLQSGMNMQANTGVKSEPDSLAEIHSAQQSMDQEHLTD